jgi:thiol-disulfide isomerase/thioredoxin
VPTGESGLLLLCFVACALVFDVWFLINLLKQNGRLLLRVEALEARLGSEREDLPGLPVGADAPGFRVTGLDGEVYELDTLRAAGKPLLLVFVEPNCPSCAEVMPDLSLWEREHVEHLTIALISSGDRNANPY